MTGDLFGAVGLAPIANNKNLFDKQRNISNQVSNPQDCIAMEFHQIRYFLAACDHLNFTRAAESCAVSQPALTVAIQKLEADLGAPLFLRSGRQIELTDLGQSMRIHFARIEQGRKAAQIAARHLIDNEMAHVDLGVMCTIGPALFGPALELWRREGNDVELILHNIWGDRMFELLLSGALDCALVASDAGVPEGIQVDSVVMEPVELAMSSADPLALKPEIFLSDLHDRNYVDRLHCEFREGFFNKLRDQDMVVEIVLRSEREDWIQQAVHDGLGVSFLPRNSVIVSGITTRPVIGVDVVRQIQIATVRDRPMRKSVRNFVDFVKGFDWHQPR